MHEMHWAHPWQQMDKKEMNVLVEEENATILVYE